jgi:hypothetical protein
MMPLPMEVVSSSSDIEDSIPSGVQFSPDGLCVLTSVRDEFRLYNSYDATPQLEEQPHQDDPEQPQRPPVHPWRAALRYKGGDVVQSYDWYPHMTSNDAGTCCFVGTSREQPIHLYDAYYAGLIRATYVPMHPDREEVISPLVVQFDSTGSKVICGGYPTDRLLHIFDITRPGKDSLVCYKLGKTRRSQDGQKGLVSSLACATKSTNLFAVGTYSPGSIYLYDMRMSTEEGVAIVLHGGVSVVGHGKRVKRFPIITNNGDNDDDHTSIGDSIFSFAKAQWYQKRAQMGITQLEFCQSDHALLSASRKSDAVLKWDIRMMTDPQCAIQPICGVQSYAVNHNTNQRMQFHVHQSTPNSDNNHDNNHDDTLVSMGDQDANVVHTYNIVTGTLVETIPVRDVPNGVSVHSDCMAVSLGERCFDDGTMVCQGSIQLLRRRHKS